jgi:hypothetical protein
MSAQDRKQYIGDGVYVDVEHGMLKLTTHQESGTQVIYLELDVYVNLIEYARAVGFVQPQTQDGGA